VTIEIHEARSDEYAEAGAVTAEAYREFANGGSDWTEYLAEIADVEGRASRTTIVVAVDDGRVIGSATLELDARTDAGSEPLDADEAHIRMLGVHPDARGNGVATRIMADCEDRARRAGRSRMTLHTAQNMRAARRMYESLGYERSEDRVFPDGFVLLGYTKRLPRGHVS
jgi:ribosomal protein S18 acetylase RimI-like enzyme